MNCNSGKRKVFADEAVKAISDLIKKYELDDVFIQRDSDPVLVASRGCLKPDGEGQAQERIELTLHISPNLAKVERDSRADAKVVENSPTDVHRAFDLSEVIASDTVAQAEAPKDENGCN